jgi:hypothetical protein
MSGPSMIEMTLEEIEEWNKRMTQGMKFDNAKHRWSLLPSGTVQQIIAVLEFGAAKYKENNWQHVDRGPERYYDALMRHVHAWRDGEKNDSESGLHHLAHAGCCLLFMLWLDDRKVK